MHTVIGVPPPGELAGYREPLEDGAVSKARNACRESGGADSIRRGMRDRMAGLQEMPPHCRRHKPNN